MYFSASDREPVYASTAEYNETTSFSEEYIEPLDQEAISEYEDINYSSKTINPEYIEKYSSEEFEGEGTSEEEVEYFDESYSKYDTEDGYEKYLRDNNSNYIPNQYSSQGFSPRVNVGLGFGSGWGYSPYNWGYPRYGYGSFYDPFGMPTYGRGWNMSISYGWGMGSGWPAYPYPYSTPGAYFMDNPFFPSYYPYGRGPSYAGGGYYYCPTTGYGASPVVVIASEGNPANVRPRVSGARSTGSNNAVTSSQRSQYRSAKSDAPPIRKIEQPLQRTSGSDQKNYYRRSRSNRSENYTSASTNDRSYQRYRRSSQSDNNSSAIGSTRGSSTYRTSSGNVGTTSRGSSTSYRTYDRRSSSNSTLRSSSGSGNSWNSGRSAPSTTYRSSGPSRGSTTIRSTGGSRGSSSGVRSSSSSGRRRN